MRARFIFAVIAATVLLFPACGDKKKKSSSDDDDRHERDDDKKDKKKSDDKKEGEAGAVLAAVRDGAMHAGFVDLAGLRDRGWFDFAKLAKLPGAAEALKPIEELKAKCGTDPLSIADQIAWSGDKEGNFLLSAKLAVSEDKAVACIRGVAGRGEDAKIDGKAALQIGAAVFVVDGGAIVAGSEPWVKAHFSAEKKQPSALAKRLTSEPDVMLKTIITPDKKDRAPIVEAEGTIVSSSSRGSLTVVLESENEEDAAALEKKAKELASQIGDDLKKELPDLSLPSIERKGSRVTIEIVQEGDATKQMQMVGALSAVGIYGVRRYLQNAKAAEAKSTVGAITRSILATMEMEDLTTGKRPTRLPPSAPAVPKDVPMGTKYASTDSDWGQPAWKAIRFTMSMPQYYRYRWETSPDGKKCTVIAEGDLDGDGILSKFSREITFDGDLTKADTEIKIENENE